MCYADPTSSIMIYFLLEAPGLVIRPPFCLVYNYYLVSYVKPLFFDLFDLSQKKPQHSVYRILLGMIANIMVLN